MGRRRWMLARRWTCSITAWTCWATNSFIVSWFSFTSRMSMQFIFGSRRNHLERVTKGWAKRRMQLMTRRWTGRGFWLQRAWAELKVQSWKVTRICSNNQRRVRRLMWRWSWGAALVDRPVIRAAAYPTLTTVCKAIRRSEGKDPPTSLAKALKKAK